jgi:hypothetical protein
MASSLLRGENVFVVWCQEKVCLKSTILKFSISQHSNSAANIFRNQWEEIYSQFPYGADMLFSFLCYSTEIQSTHIYHTIPTIFSFFPSFWILCYIPTTNFCIFQTNPQLLRFKSVTNLDGQVKTFITYLLHTNHPPTLVWKEMVLMVPLTLETAPTC